MRRSLALLLVALAVSPARATHIVGGEMYYTYLGNDDYELTIKMYRDCNAATPFDDPLFFGVFGSTGNHLFDDELFPTSITDVPITVNNPCLTPPSNICTEEAVYQGTIHLPAGTGGYTIAYQRCCRGSFIANLNNPSDQGLTLTVRVPDISVTGPNSSPRFVEAPPTALCLGQPFTFDHSATDPDGDQLVYDLCAPYNGGSVMMPNPTTPAPPPYTPVPFGPAYSVSDMVNSEPPMTVDASTGELSLTPAGLGFFVVGVRVREYRNGVLLSEVIRDFQFDFVNCVVNVHSTIADQNDTSFCNGLTVQMENNSIGGGFFHWDFGVPGTLADTSDQEAPLFTYPAPGTYQVTLVANPGWPCADTSQKTFELYPPLEIGFSTPAIVCPDQMPLTITATGNFSPAANVLWDFGDGFSPDLSSHTTTVSFTGLGAHAIRVSASEHGCDGSHQDSIRVYPHPEVVFAPDTGGCTPFEVPFTQSATAWTPLRYLWDFGDGHTSNDSLPRHTYTAPGVYDVRLTVSTDTGCVATRTLLKTSMVDAWPMPTARFTADPLVTSLLDPEVTFTDHSIDAVDWDFAVAGTHYDQAPFTHVFGDAGPFDVLLTVTSDQGCLDTATVRIFVGDHLFFAPTAFSPNGDDINEYWRPEVKGARLYQLDVFDRWGQVVFSTTDPKEAWDGKNATTGIYAFKAWLSEWGPLEKEYNGTITLFR